MSESGWTNDKIGFLWLRDIFDAQTKRLTIGRYRLLVLDGHSSHNTVDFDDYCKKNNIITLYMPPHASHLLQPLDVACFAPLKRAYGHRVETLMSSRYMHITKSDFLSIYVPSRSEALTERNIRAGFRASGLCPFNPDAVLEQLGPRIRTPSPSPVPSSQDPDNGWVPRTPHTVDHIKHQARTLRKSLKNKAISTPSPTMVASKQMAKAAENAMYAFKLSEVRVAELEEEIKRLTKRRVTKRRYMKAGGLLSATDVDLTQQVVVGEGEVDTAIGSSGGAQRHCSRCSEQGHNSRTCNKSLASD